MQSTLTLPPSNVPEPETPASLEVKSTSSVGALPLPALGKLTLGSVASDTSKFEGSASEAKAESSASEAKAEGSASEAKAESSASEAKAASSASEAKAESSASEAKAESSASEAKAESSASEAKFESSSAVLRERKVEKTFISRVPFASEPSATPSVLPTPKSAEGKTEEKKTPSPASIYDHAMLAKQYAQHYIKRGCTQLVENHTSDEQNQSLYRSMLELRDENCLDVVTSLSKNAAIARFEEKVKQSKKYSLGNCYELALIALDYFATEAPHISAEVVSIVRGDHAFLVVNRKKGSNIKDPTTWGKEAYICDPWSNSVYKAEDYLKKNSDGKTTLQAYDHYFQYQVPFDYDPNDDPYADQIFEPGQIIHVRDTFKGLFVCDPESGKILSRPPKCELNLMRVVNTTRSFQPGYHELENEPHLTSGEIYQSRLKDSYEKIYHKKLQALAKAAENLFATLTSIGTRLREKYGTDDDKYLIILAKQKHLEVILNDLKRKLASKSSSTAEMSDQLRLNLRTSLQDCCGTAQLDAKEVDILRTHRDETRFQRFFSIPPKTVNVLQDAITTFNKSIHSLGQ